MDGWLDGLDLTAHIKAISCRSGIRQMKQSKNNTTY